MMSEERTIPITIHHNFNGEKEEKVTIMITQTAADNMELLADKMEERKQRRLKEMIDGSTQRK